MRLLVALWPWGLALVLLAGGLAFALPPEYQSTALNVASLLGMLLLAVPAIRINEQGRLIASVQGLQQGIEAGRKALEEASLSADKRAQHRKSLEDRESRLAATLKELSGGKGAWTRPVHVALYGGYVLLLASAIARVVP